MVYREPECRGFRQPARVRCQLKSKQWVGLIRLCKTLLGDMVVLKMKWVVMRMRYRGRWSIRQGKYSIDVWWLGDSLVRDGRQVKSSKQTRPTIFLPALCLQCLPACQTQKMDPWILNCYPFWLALVTCGEAWAILIPP